MEVTKAQAEGMRKGIFAQYEREGRSASASIYNTLDFDKPADRRIIASVYADMARPAIDALRQS